MNIVKNVVIVGGGSSAWLTAAYLSKQCPHINFTVVDKEIGNPIGVGEGTLLSFQKYMSDCGFVFGDWFNEIDATYKTGALFPDWLEIGHEIWHPFTMSPTLDENIFLQQAWSHHQDLDFKTRGLALYELAVKNNMIDTSIIDGYGFHVDAGKLVQFIQNKIKDRVNFIASDVVELIKNGNDLKAVVLANKDIVEADLFIDCTGFKSILRNDRKRVELLGRVFCDTAACAQIQYKDMDTEMRPYTRAQAVDHGWIWTIPTQARMGSGLIFNKNITTVEEAKQRLVDYWGEDRLQKENIRIIDWTPYYIENAWQNNVISVGMSSGFIEPLESTGLALVQYQAHSIMNIIKGGFWTEDNVVIYNKEFKMRFEDCVDFVSAHYSKTNRTEKFWQFVKETYKPTKNILMHLKMLEDGPRHGSQTQYAHVFAGTNWTTWMYQLGYKIGADKKITKEDAKFLLDRYYNTLEKFRTNWGQKHSVEIMRFKEHAKYYRKN